MKNLLFVIAFLFTFQTYAQDDLMSMLEEENPTPTNTKVIATFKGAKIINAHTNELVKAKTLDFRITHRFGNIGGDSGGGFHTLYGFDQSEDIRISFDYGINDFIQVGIARSKRMENIDGNLKAKILHQRGDNSIPVSMVWFSNFAFTPQRDIDNRYSNASSRLSYVHQLIVARKFSNSISFEVLPTLVHRNLVERDPFGIQDENTFFSLGFAARVKLSQRVAIVADYFYNFSDYRTNHPNLNFYNPLGVGIEIETGGHVFNLAFTNASGIIENNYLTTTSDDWLKGGYKFGFNISRVFTIGK